MAQMGSDAMTLIKVGQVRGRSRIGAASIAITMNARRWCPTEPRKVVGRRQAACRTLTIHEHDKRHAAHGLGCDANLEVQP